MTIPQVAALFSVTGVGVALAASLFIVRRQPTRYFRAWTASKAFLFALLVFELVVVFGARSPLTTLVEAPCLVGAAWFVAETGASIRGGRLGAITCGMLAAGVVALSAAMLALGASPSDANLPGALALAGAYGWLGLVLVSRRTGEWAWRVLGVVVGLSGLWILAYPLLERTMRMWLQYFVGGALEVLTATWMIALVMEEVASELRQVDRVRDRFLASVSHELRTPLNYIVGLGDVLAAERLTPDQKKCVGGIRQGAERLLQLIEDLLDYASVQAGRLAFTPEAIDLRPLIAQTLDRLAPEVAERHHRVELSVPEAVPLVWADPRRAARVLAALMENAVRYTPPGGSVRVRAHVDGRWVRCEVEDSGPGVAPASQPRLFDGMADGGGAATAGGIGLGLAISRAFVEAHGGEIGVASPPEGGSRFWFTLPVAPAPAPR